MKTVLITGANRGLGFETAKQLLQRGFNVILSARNESAGMNAVEDLKEYENNIEFFTNGCRR